MKGEVSTNCVEEIQRHQFNKTIQVISHQQGINTAKDTPIPTVTVTPIDLLSCDPIPR